MKFREYGSGYLVNIQETLTIIMSICENTF